MPRFIALPVLLLGLMVPSAFAAVASQPSDDAWPLYDRAIQHVAEGDLADIYAPAASSLMHPEYPPYPPAWHRLENESYIYNATARAMLREARSRKIANWPILRHQDGTIDMSYLNGCRNVANEVGDAALYQHLHGDEPAAIESVRDLLHMADLMERPSSPALIQSMVAVGVRMIAMSRLEIITSDLALTEDSVEYQKLQTGTARELIRQLFDVQDIEPRYADLIKRERAAGQVTQAQTDRFLVQMRRGQMELNLAAMSLACHLFRFEKGRWPASVEELTAYLPAAPRDAWGPMGYVLLKPDKPGAIERPLVYSHCNASDGLFYFTSEPSYSWVSGFRTGNTHKQGGQFRDVTLWSPAHPDPAPTTQPLQ